MAAIDKNFREGMIKQIFDFLQMGVMRQSGHAIDDAMRKKLANGAKKTEEAVYIQTRGKPSLYMSDIRKILNKAKARAHGTHAAVPAPPPVPPPTL
eukprot:COSAG01_NODE_37092_length_508_cov_1.577017_1_plen_95_part_01